MDPKATQKERKMTSDFPDMSDEWFELYHRKFDYMQYQMRRLVDLVFAAWALETWGSD